MTIGSYVSIRNSQTVALVIDVCYWQDRPIAYVLKLREPASGQRYVVAMPDEIENPTRH